MKYAILYSHSMSTLNLGLFPSVSLAWPQTTTSVLFLLTSKLNNLKVRMKLFVLLLLQNLCKCCRSQQLFPVFHLGYDNYALRSDCSDCSDYHTTQTVTAVTVWHTHSDCQIRDSECVWQHMTHSDCRDCQTGNCNCDRQHMTHSDCTDCRQETVTVSDNTTHTVTGAVTVWQIHSDHQIGDCVVSDNTTYTVTTDKAKWLQTRQSDYRQDKVTTDKTKWLQTRQSGYRQDKVTVDNIQSDYRQDKTKLLQTDKTKWLQTTDNWQTRQSD